MGLREDQEQTQKRVFTRWANLHLKRRGKEITDLETDLQDGLLLLNLLMQLTGETIKIPAPKPKIQIHYGENLGAALKFLTAQKFTDSRGKEQSIKLVNVGPKDIAGGNLGIILGLMFTIILRVRIADDDVADKQGLVLWAQKALAKYPEVRIQDLHRSWNTGLGFAGLVCRFRPDLLNWDEVPKGDARAATEQAFAAAGRAGIGQLLDVDDVVTEIPDEKSVFTQVLQYFRVFASGAAKAQAAEKVLMYVELVQQRTTLGSEYEALARAFLEWCNTGITATLGAMAPADESLAAARAGLKAFRAWQNEGKVSKFQEKSRVQQAWQALEWHIRSHQLAEYTPGEGLSIAAVAQGWAQAEEAETGKLGELQGAVAAGEDALRQAFAGAAQAFLEWIEAPKQTLAQLLDPKNGSAAERLPRAQALLGEVSGAGAERQQAATAAQKACDDALAVENRFTDTTLADVDVAYQSLSGQVTAAIEWLETDAALDVKRRAFADAAQAFQDFSAQSSTTLDQASRAEASGDSVARARGVVARVEGATGLIGTDGTPLFDAAVAAWQELVNVGQTAEPMTTDTGATLRLAWAELQDNGASLLRNARLALGQAEQLAEAAAAKRSDVQKSFTSFDQDKDGGLNLSEFKGALKALGETMTDDQAAILFKRLDKDRSEKIDFEEFLSFMTQRDSGGFDYASMVTAFRMLAGSETAKTMPRATLLGIAESDEQTTAIQAVAGDGEGDFDILGWCAGQFGAPGPAA